MERVMTPSRSAFILPLVLLLAAPLIVLSLLALERARTLSEHREGLSLDRQVRETVRFNTAQLVRLLEARLATGGASARVPAEAGDPPPWVSRIILGEGHEPLHSISFPDTRQPAAFRAFAGPGPLAAEWTGSVPGSPGIRIAWAAEDLSLGTEGTEPAMPFWPLPSWNLAPTAGNFDFPAFMDRTTRHAWRAFAPVPAGEPLVMDLHNPASPLPVVGALELRFGVFASGHVRSREKTVRIRFYVEGALWNPYNRDLVAHPGRGNSPTFRVVFWNLPEIRIHNRSRGMSSGWLPLDQAANSYTGSTGFDAWIRLPQRIPAGESVRFTEPDADWQPQGLARTLHAGFLVGPADSIEIEWRQPPGGLHAACLPLQTGDPFQAALDGEGWWRAEGFPVALPEQRYRRADAGPRPFFLHGGSLSFRRRNARISLSFQSGPAARALLADPRPRRFSGRYPWTGADGHPHPPEALLEAVVTIDPPEAPGSTDGLPALLNEAVFSWPVSRPATFREAIDLPCWPDGFRLGSAQADALNTLLDRPGWWNGQNPGVRSTELPDPGEALFWKPVFPVNLVSVAAWGTLLRASSSAPGSPNPARFPLFSSPLPEQPGSHGEWDSAAIGRAARFLAAEAGRNPVHSVNAFFTTGRLAAAFEPLEGAGLKHFLLPLRAWIRSGPAPAPRGHAWVLHLAASRSGRDDSITRTARVWLLQTAPAGEAPRLEVIRFEWTDPRSHLMPPHP